MCNSVFMICSKNIDFYSWNKQYKFPQNAPFLEFRALCIAGPKKKDSKSLVPLHISDSRLLE